ncbi:hypothetical protein SDC9_74126 [bioreactor metagenome]|uniref:Uncharacterized protein n=1 Tax=bioreactor metagenome TaxID=1076179 RepID=A0A644YM92_9ZZZZ
MRPEPRIRPPQPFLAVVTGNAFVVHVVRHLATPVVPSVCHANSLIHPAARRAPHRPSPAADVRRRQHQPTCPTPEPERVQGTDLHRPVPPDITFAALLPGIDPGRHDQSLLLTAPHPGGGLLLQPAEHPLPGLPHPQPHRPRLRLRMQP